MIRQILPAVNVFNFSKLWKYKWFKKYAICLCFLKSKGKDGIFNNDEDILIKNEKKSIPNRKLQLS